MRNVILCLSLSQFTGVLNNLVRDAEGNAVKFRVNYKKLLRHLANGRKVVGAHIISQEGPNDAKKPAHVKFLNNLPDFGWNVKTISYDRNDPIAPALDIVWGTLLTPLLDESRNLTIDPMETDIVFVNGSENWVDLMSAFSSYQFSVEIAFPLKATSNKLQMMFPCYDLTPYITQPNTQKEN